MTLVNFRRAICHLQLRRCALLHLRRLFRASASKLQREFHQALFSHSSSPGEAKVRDLLISREAESSVSPFSSRLSYPLCATMYRTLLPLLSVLHHRPLSHSPFPPSAHAHTHTYTSLQNFLTLRRYKYLQPHRRSSTTRVSWGRRTRWTRTYVGVSVLCAAFVHTYTHARYRADGALHLFHARWFAMPSPVHALESRSPLTTIPTLTRKGPKYSLEWGREKGLNIPVALSASVDWPPDVFCKNRNCDTTLFRTVLNNYHVLFNIK